MRYKSIMLLIYVSHWLYPQKKVNPRVAMRTLEEFVRQGHRAELWVPWRRNRDPDLKGVDPFEYHRIQRVFTIRRLPAIDLIGILPGKLGFFLMVATFNVSVVFYAILRRVLYKAIFYCLELRDIVFLTVFKPKIFYEIHDFYKTPIALLNRWCYQNARGLITTNRLKMPILKKEFDIPMERIFHKPNAVDTSMFRISASREEARKKIGLPQDQVIILYCGQVVLWKGADGLLAAHSFLKPNEFIYFNVSGDDITIGEFEERKRALDPKNVIVVKGVTHKDIPMWLRAADVLVLPNTARDHASKFDTSPVKLFEYMASGRPIVCSDLPSLRNVVDDTMVWFYEPDNPEALADAIHAVFDNPQKSEEKSKKAQEEAEKYTWDRRFKDIFGFIEVRLATADRPKAVIPSDSEESRRSKNP